MTYQEIDFIFPFVVFGYGLVMTLILNQPALVKIGEERLPKDLFLLFHSHKVTGLVCLIVGGIWTLQNLWFSGQM